jgi:hypothetical protein
MPEYASRAGDNAMKAKLTAISHLIQPLQADISSDLLVAQPITFETMRLAYEFGQRAADLKLVAIQFRDERPVPLPECFIRLPGLVRSVTDLKDFRVKRKLPLIADILNSLYQASHDEYFIFTNVDIALQSHFYQAVAKIIEGGYDAFVINRRTIPSGYHHIDQIPLMYAEAGEPHPGYDCFVFRREMYPKFKLGTICIGTAWVGRTLLANMVTFSSKFKEFKNEHLTFHIGNSRPWRKDEFKDYFRKNHDEYLRIFGELEKERGGFAPCWRSYLLDTGSKRQFPEFE